MSDPFDLVRLSRSIADRSVAPVAGRLVDGVVAAVDGDEAAIAKHDPSAPPTPGFHVPPHLVVQAGDHVWAYDDGGFKLIIAVLNRQALHVPFVGARVARSTAQTITNDTSTALLFTTDVQDEYEMHDDASNTDVLVIPPDAGGLWIAVASARFASNATGYRSLVLTVDDEVAADVTEATVVPAPSGVAARLQTVRLMDLDPYQAVRAVVRHTRTADLDIEAATLAIWRASTQ